MPETFGENRTSPDDHAGYFLIDMQFAQVDNNSTVKTVTNVDLAP